MTTPDAPHVFAHSVPGDTSLHTGPPEGCTLPACAPAPLGALAGREQRRRTTANILARIDRAKHIQEDEATLLRTLVTAEQADGDQARAQRDQAGASLTDLRNDLYAERRAHEEHRRSLAVLHGLHPDADWLNVTAAATSVLRARDRDRRFLTEARRLRDEACGALDSQQLAVSETLGLGTSAPWDAIVERAGALAADPLRRMLDSPVAGVAALGAAAHEHAARMVREANERAEQAQQEAREARRGETEAVRAREAAEQQLGESETVGHKLLQRAEFAEEQLTAAVKRADLAERVKRTAAKDAAEALGRAVQAEATLTAVRAAVGKALDDAAACDGDDCRIDHREAVRAALGDPQPATEPRCVCGDPIERWTGPGDPGWIHTPGSDTPCLDARPAADPCAHGCRQVADDVTRLGQKIDAAPEPREVCCVCGCPDVTYHNYREQPFCCRCAMCCDPPQLCAHECKQPTCPAQNTATPDRVAHCDLPAHHDEDHRDSTVPGILRWTDDVAVYPATAEREQPAEPQQRSTAPQVHVHLDNRGAVYHPWPQEWRAQPTEGGKSEYRRNVDREAEQHVTVYGISVNEWDRLWLTVQRIADAAGVKPA